MEIWRQPYRTPKLDGDVTLFYDARAKAADPLLFALETLVWERSLFVNYGLPEATAETCKVYGIDVKKIEAAAKEKPPKLAPQANPELPVKPGAKAKAAKKS